MGTAEVENAINEHPKVIESAVVGYPHDIKGQGIYAFAICDMEGRTADNLIDEIKQTVSKIILLNSVTENLPQSNQILVKNL